MCRNGFVNRMDNDYIGWCTMIIVVAVQESGPFFCRGESKIFPTSRSTWDRCIPKDKKAKSIYQYFLGSCEQ